MPYSTLLPAQHQGLKKPLRKHLHKIITTVLLPGGGKND